MPRPDYWAFVDRLNAHHGPEGQAALGDKRIRKATLNKRQRLYGDRPNIEFLARAANMNTSLKFLEQEKPYLSAKNQSITFAVQWCLLGLGFRRLIFVGCDLDCSEGRWSHKTDVGRRQMKKSTQQQTLDTLVPLLESWTRVAVDKGYEFISWSPGRINDFMPRYEP